ncbi:MAG: pentapeptide repeat-containing protein [Chloroflexi bacterium]|nr:pentapeptide repeat-containing protein [Chloroflexota bacterium]
MLLALITFTIGKENGMASDKMYIGVSYAGADLSSETLDGIFLNVDFSYANLRGADLRGCFIGGSFRGADLRGASHRHARFVEVDCTDTVWNDE